MYVHEPVMVEEVLQLLSASGGLSPGRRFLDCTVGAGGHASEILRRILPGGFLLGLDIDSSMLALAKACFTSEGFPEEAWRLFNLSYTEMEQAIGEAGLSGKKFHGIIFDCGVASQHLDDPARGFSCDMDGPLDLRFDVTKSLNGATVVNRWSEKELRRILKEYANERFAGAIARGIRRARELRPITTTFQLAEIIRKAVPPRFRSPHRNYVQTGFQAIRIAVNGELDALRDALPVALANLDEMGVCSVISFQSGEDRIVKRCFAEAVRKVEAGRTFELLTPKPLRPSEGEIQRNPRSRSAKLRAIRKLSSLCVADG
ncbi:MAG: 16S rRNA (cytosine(1402)-N(4))-methyltransferase RsmH [Candidatus Sumerlaeota bacterium]|nr:16S rRNA (cytosine(1402)-N(4))-methyltransferase RsmH [Candidatus Sumerlaeota bacterium]